MSETIILKTCRTCNQTKLLSKFNKRKDSKDGHRSECKICKKQQDKKYSQTEKFKITQKRYKQSEKGKAIQQATMKRFFARNPNKMKATNAVNHAIRDNKLSHPNTRLCYYCPKPAQQYHHWHGYEKAHWLDIIPVCQICHVKIHKKLA